MSWLFASGGHGIRASASASVLPMSNSGLISFRMDWFELLATQGTLKRVFSSTTVWKHQFFGTCNYVIMFWPLTTWSSDCHLLIVCSQMKPSHLPALISVKSRRLTLSWCSAPLVGLHSLVFSQGSLSSSQKWFSATETNGDLIDYITEEWAEVSGGGEKSTANKMKVLSFLFPQISFSAAPALKDCSRGPFSAVILNWVTSHPFLQHLPLKFQWFFTDVCRVVSSFFHSMCDPLKAGLSRPHISLQSQTKKLSQRQLRLAN